MTTYHIQSLDCTIDTTQGDDTLSVPSYLRVQSVSSKTAVLSKMITEDQNCYILPLDKDGPMDTAYKIFKSPSGQHLVYISQTPTLAGYYTSSDYGYTFSKSVDSRTDITAATVTDAGAITLYYETFDYTYCTGAWRVAVDSSGNLIVISYDRLNVYRNGSLILTSPSNYFQDVACSQDGTKITVLDGNTTSNKIWVSTDSGSSFTDRTPGSSLLFTAVAMSDDGVYQVAAATELIADGGGIYRSTNSGTSWTKVLSVKTPSNVAISPDGSVYQYVPNDATVQTFLAVKVLTNTIQVRFDGTSGSTGIYRSINAGSTWNLHKRLPMALHTISNIGGDYGIGLVLPDWSSRGLLSWTAGGWLETVSTDLQNEMCDYFEEEKYYTYDDGVIRYSTINLYFLNIIIDGFSGDPTIIPIFYAGNNPNADRTYTP